MAPKKITKKKSTKVAKTSEEDSVLQDVGSGILKFFEMLFAFILSFFKILPELLKAIAWVVIAAILAGFLVVLLAYFALSAFGIKDSEQFQAYRELVVGKMIEEHELDNWVLEDVEEVAEVEEVIEITE